MPTNKITNQRYNYDYFKKVFDGKVEEFEQRLAAQELIIKEKADYIRSRFTEVPVFGKLDFNKLEHTDLEFYIKHHGSFYTGTLIEKAFIIELKLLSKMLLQRIAINSQFTKYKNRFVSYQEFQWIVKETFKLMVDQMLEKGKRFKIIDRLGYFAVSSRKNSPSQLVINHAATKINKQRLIDEGKIVKSEENPDGVSYNVYYTDHYFFRIKWTKNNSYDTSNLVGTYKFKSKNGPTSLVRRLYKLMKERPEITLLYNNS